MMQFMITIIIITWCSNRELEQIKQWRVFTGTVLSCCCVGVHLGHWRCNKAAGSRQQQQDRVTEHCLCVFYWFLTRDLTSWLSGLIRWRAALRAWLASLAVWVRLPLLPACRVRFLPAMRLNSRAGTRVFACVVFLNCDRPSQPDWGASGCGEPPAWITDGRCQRLYL